MQPPPQSRWLLWNMSRPQEALALSAPWAAEGGNLQPCSSCTQPLLTSPYTFLSSDSIFLSFFFFSFWLQGGGTTQFSQLLFERYLITGSFFPPTHTTKKAKIKMVYYQNIYDSSANSSIGISQMSGLVQLRSRRY